MTLSRPEPVEEPLPAAWRAFLEACGVTPDTGGRLLAGGANNRVFHVSGPGRDCVIKHYYHGAEETRDRFTAERDFYSHLKRAGVECIPKPLGWSVDLRLGVFEHVRGRRPHPTEVNADALDQAIAFVCHANAARRHPESARLGPAAEACFSVSDHLACVDRRVVRLRELREEDAESRAAKAFVQDDLGPLWDRVRSHVLPGSRALGTTAGVALDPTARCLSPSDFGFHNALREEDGRLRFFDFEYAGWDDPAKLVCDFFCQPQVPVPHRWWTSFLERLSEGLPGVDRFFPSRAALLLPVYQVKWCCILLNEFVHEDQGRRQFASREAVDGSRKRAQLAKARTALNALRARRSGAGGG